MNVFKLRYVFLLFFAFRILYNYFYCKYKLFRMLNNLYVSLINFLPNIRHTTKCKYLLDILLTKIFKLNYTQLFIVHSRDF